MNLNDDKLKALLRQWSEIEPKSNFEANVWRRIRTAADQPEGLSLAEAIGRLLWQPGWSMVVALLVAVAVGVWGGVVTTAPRADSTKTELQFLAPGTLAGSYLQMEARETR